MAIEAAAISVDVTAPPVNSTARVLVASLAGTTIEFFDFYIFATAAVLVFPKLFFPASDPTTAKLQSFATFALAFVARPFGSAVFGHFGDRIGRKATLVAALLTMGISTVSIGFLPTYATLGVFAPILLSICRFGQGFGLGGEWGGAVLLATENAPAHRRAWFGMFPQLGAPLGFAASSSIFLLLSKSFSEKQFIEFAWRIPFVASSVLVLVGLYVRLKISETPVFQKAIVKDQRVAMPLMTMIQDHWGVLVLGTLIALSNFVLFYLLTVFCLSWGTSALGFSRQEFLSIQIPGVLCFAATIPAAAHLAERAGRKRTLLVSTGVIAIFGLFFGRLFAAGTIGAILTMVVGFALMGMIYGPLGTMLSELFPTPVRYTGSSMSFNLSGILGASLAPYVATKLAGKYGLSSVGYYLTIAAILTLVALFFSHETRGKELSHDI